MCGEICLNAAECPECVKATFSSGALVVVPACRHLVNVQMLDTQGLNTIYDIDKNGNINTFKPELVDVPAVPTCDCGAAITCGRYSIIDKLHNCPNVFDRLLAKVGRKMNMFADRIYEQESILVDTFGIFCHNIRPNPLAARVNKQSLFARGTPIVNDVQNKIVNFRGKSIYMTRFLCCYLVDMYIPRSLTIGR